MALATGIVLFSIAVLVDLAAAWSRALRPGPDSDRRAPHLLARTLAAVPAAWTVAFAALVARAWVRVGERPRGIEYEHVEGHVMPFLFRHANVDVGAFASHATALRVALFAVPMCWALALVVWVTRLAWRERAEVLRACFGTLALVGVAALVAADPGGFWNWFRD